MREDEEMSDDRFHVRIDINAPHDGPVYRADLSKHSPQPPLGGRHGPVIPTGCDRCDFIGPLDRGAQFDAALHDIFHVLAEELRIDRFVDWLARKLT